VDADNLGKVAAELDAAHAAAKRAYLARDLVAYMDVFLPDLTYHQPDGRVIGRDRLAQDVANQFANVGGMDSSYVRESIENYGSDVIEVLEQTAWAEVVAFFVIKKKWRLKRRGRYVWTQTSAGWRIKHVEVLEEKVL
jgi:hypothetical protein